MYRVAEEKCQKSGEALEGTRARVLGADEGQIRPGRQVQAYV